MVSETRVAMTESIFVRSGISSKMFGGWDEPVGELEDEAVAGVCWFCVTCGWGGMALGPGLKFTAGILTSGGGEIVLFVAWALNGIVSAVEEGGGIGADPDVELLCVSPFTKTVGGGVARRTDPVGRAGTCSDMLGFAGRFVGG